MNLTELLKPMSMVELNIANAFCKNKHNIGHYDLDISNGEYIYESKLGSLVGVTFTIFYEIFKFPDINILKIKVFTFHNPIFKTYT